jgi:hypothetical protein
MRSAVVVAAVVAVALVAFAFILNGAAPTEVTSTQANTQASTASQSCPSIPSPRGKSITISAAGGTWPGCDCTLVASNSHGLLYVSTEANVGDLVCLAASLSDSDTVAFTITNSTGSVILQTPFCTHSGGAPGRPPSTGISCRNSWDTAAPDAHGDAVKAETYHLVASDIQGSPGVLEANFTLSANSSESGHTCVNQSSSSSTSGGNAQGPQHLASAVTPNLYFNNSIYQGPPVTFTVKPGSHASMVVNVSYPWQNVQPPPTQGFCVEFSFTIGPFPANSNVSTIPDWMHVSLSVPSIEIPYESNASVNLLASVDDSAPQDSNASFEFLIHYLDPASGNAVTGSYVVSIQT